MVKFEINPVLQVFVWACSWQCVNLLVMYSAGKVTTPVLDFLICLLKQTLHMLLNECVYIFFLNRCQFYRIWSWNKTSSGGCCFGKTNENFCIMIPFFAWCVEILFLTQVIEMPEHNPGQMGGTMRLGKRRTLFKNTSSVLRKLWSFVPL